MKLYRDKKTGVTVAAEQWRPGVKIPHVHEEPAGDGMVGVLVGPDTGTRMVAQEGDWFVFQGIGVPSVVALVCSDEAFRWQFLWTHGFIVWAVGAGSMEARAVLSPKGRVQPYDDGRLTDPLLKAQAKPGAREEMELREGLYFLALATDALARAGAPPAIVAEVGKIAETITDYRTEETVRTVGVAGSRSGLNSTLSVMTDHERYWSAALAEVERLKAQAAELQTIIQTGKAANAKLNTKYQQVVAGLPRRTGKLIRQRDRLQAAQNKLARAIHNAISCIEAGCPDLAKKELKRAWNRCGLVLPEDYTEEAGDETQL